MKNGAFPFALSLILFCCSPIFSSTKSDIFLNDFDHTESANWPKNLPSDSTFNQESATPKGDELAVIAFRKTVASSIKRDPEAVLALADELEKAAKDRAYRPKDFNPGSNNGPHPPGA